MRSIDANRSLLRRWPLPDLSHADGKEDRGRVLIVAGSREIPGAALLAGHASLRAGAGKLHIAASADVAPQLAIAVPEARVSGLPTNRSGEIVAAGKALLGYVEDSDVLLVGPGMVSSAATTRVASRCAKRAKAAVFDAGALDAATPGPNVMTPHFGEMAELCDCSREAVERAPGPIALEVAKSRRCIVALKGVCTFIASPDDELWIYRGGSIGLGTSGSGDVLAGVIAGLIAQGAAAPQAAVWGVVLHGEAGAALSKANGRVGFLAREIADQIPRLRARLDRPASR